MICDLNVNTFSLRFEEKFRRAKKNSIDIFPEIIFSEVKSVSVNDYDRSFYISIDVGEILFKLHGRQSNIILIKEKTNVLFRKNILKDAHLKLTALQRKHDINNLKEKDFDHVRAVVSKYYLHKDKLDMEYLIPLVKKLLNSKDFHLYKNQDGKPSISLLPRQEILISTAKSPIEACHQYFQYFTHEYMFLERKNNIQREISRNVTKIEQYLSKTRKKLEEIDKKRSDEEIANIIMAGLHDQREYKPLLTLPDIYYPGRTLQIKLKPNQKLTDLAESYYRKAKSIHIQKDKLKIILAGKEKIKSETIELARKVELTKSHKELNKIYPKQKEKTTKNEQAPFKKLHFKGFEILVGRNAKNNDLLTLKVASKNDFWLHAKDVTGSHMVVRNPEKLLKLPNSVLEYAASIAAFHSKRRSDSLCPVIYTFKKYVRKRKGDPPGLVIVEKEEVIMVIPKSPDNWL